MRLLTLISLLVLVIISTSFMSYFILFKSDIKDVRRIPMDIEVGRFVGINVANDSLHFGATTGGGSARRNLTIRNTYRSPVQVTIKTEGEMKGWISGYKPTFELAKNEQRELMIRASPPRSASIGKYNGTFIVIFRKT